MTQQHDKALLGVMFEAAEDYLNQVVLMNTPGLKVADAKAKRDFARTKFLDAVEAVWKAANEGGGDG